MEEVGRWDGKEDVRVRSPKESADLIRRTVQLSCNVKVNFTLLLVGSIRVKELSRISPADLSVYVIETLLHVIASGSKNTRGGM